MLKLLQIILSQFLNTKIIINKFIYYVINVIQIIFADMLVFIIKLIKLIIVLIFFNIYWVI